MPQTASSDFKNRVEFGNLEANLRFLDETQALRPGMRILEIGSGRGTMLHHLIEQGYDVHGTEIRDKWINAIRERFGEMPVTKVEGTELPFHDDSFDAAIAFDVIEHIPDPDAHLAEIVRVLRPNGIYLIQTPNRYTNTIFETIRHRSFTKWRSNHCSLHTRRELARRFERFGFTMQFFEIPVVNEFFRAKVRSALGAPGLLMLRLLNPDRWPKFMRTNIYAMATLDAKTPAFPEEHD